MTRSSKTYFAGMVYGIIVGMMILMFIHSFSEGNPPKAVSSSTLSQLSGELKGIEQEKLEFYLDYRLMSDLTSPGDVIEYNDGFVFRKYAWKEKCSNIDVTVEYVVDDILLVTCSCLFEYNPRAEELNICDCYVTNFQLIEKHRQLLN